jgi:ATP phosphoribosyltransferase
MCQACDAAHPFSQDLGFGKCRLSVQAPVKSGITGAAELSGARIVTSFPALTRAFFDKFDAKSGKTTSESSSLVVYPSRPPRRAMCLTEMHRGPATAEIRTVSGSVEAACGLGLADAVVDLVETGTTMRVSESAIKEGVALLSKCVCVYVVTQAAGLEVVDEVLVSESVLISNPDSPHQDLIKLIQRRIEGYITATKCVCSPTGAKTLLGWEGLGPTRKLPPLCPGL